MPDEQLRQAVSLAKQGQTAAALQFVKRHIRENMDDERGWYLLARLVSDERIKREALERVLALNPYHEKALTMLRALDPLTDTFVFDNVSLFDSTPVPVRVVAPQYDIFTEATYADQVLPDADSDFFQVAELPLPRQKSLAKAKSGAGEFWVGLGVILLALMLAFGVGYYAYAYQHRGLFGLFGPDLSQVANAGQFTIHYPDGWYAASSAAGVVAANTDVSMLMGNDIETVSAETLLTDPSIFDRMFGEDGLQLLIMAPVTPGVLTGLQSNGLPTLTSGRDYITQTIATMEMFANDDQVKVERDDQRIGGEAGTVGYFEIEDDKTDVALAAYIAAVTHNGQEYIFMYYAINKSGENHGRLVERILHSVEFAN